MATSGRRNPMGQQASSQRPSQGAQGVQGASRVVVARPRARYPYLRLHLHGNCLVDTLIALNDRILARRAASVTEVRCDMDFYWN